MRPSPVLPAPWRPTSMRTSTSLRASCQARSLLAGPRFLPFGGLCQRGVETQAVTPSCPITRTPSSRCAGFASLCPLSLSLSLTHTLCAIYPTLPPHNRTRVSCPLSPLWRSLSFFSLLFFVFVFAFAFSSSLSFLLPLCTSILLFFFTSASSSRCLSSWSSSSPLFPPQLTHAGSSHFGFGLSCWEEWTLVVEQRSCRRTSRVRRVWLGHVLERLLGLKRRRVLEHCNRRLRTRSWRTS